jgi:hypothetical protein
MKKLTLVYATICCMALNSCDFKAGDKKAGVKTKEFTSEDNSALNGAIIKNNIDVDATGVKVKEVYLLDADYKPLTENKARIGEKIHLVIKMDTGWVKENGKSYIGASEKVLTSAGRVVLSADDLFKEQEVTGLDIKDATVISLSAIITEADPGLDNFEVRFRVWDKKGTGEVRGKYYFSLKKD